MYRPLLWFWISYTLSTPQIAHPASGYPTLHPQKGHGTRDILPHGKDMGPQIPCPPDRMTHLWKHYLPVTSLAGGNKWQCTGMVTEFQSQGIHLILWKPFWKGHLIESLKVYKFAIAFALRYEIDWIKRSCNVYYSSLSDSFSSCSLRYYRGLLVSESRR